MELILPLMALLAISAGANVWLALLLRRKAKAPKPQPTLTAEQLLHDLTAGQAIVRVEVVDPTNLFLRSPRR